MTQDKAKGKAEEMAGKARQAYGDMADDPEQRSEGEAQETKGKARGKMGELKEKAEEIAEDIKDKL